MKALNLQKVLGRLKDKERQEKCISQDMVYMVSSVCGVEHER